ncbi:hypothetical protein NJB14197_41590 [Mycobacterium montefiorense]|uniref:Uncharacterized protein n=1 Tax=Mycobacterium montefiorense TaxID=154654 RepID=A0AA37PNU6_9MYCO|nr:hypothetical protein MmonteBS_02810 [Mycobacterium montefiorense]GKU35413.1 hypothetical protein NJB14191_27590 [Mycobacterium montefiorense]GKU40414.1 hypothetical protein NJB14192_24010 [Mycobacterium montefiorense]GKU45792.1 hypothetical protein NJB14194_24130 [Mycobacterium montefiorense]GKU50148.1 hypothetical protein NJB14195_13940 [Mycobacterium montefiorense]
MKLVADSGLWTLGPVSPESPLAAVLEVSGAVLSWTVDDPSGDGRARITFTDLSRTDWLWRVFGEAGHVALAGAAAAMDGATSIELTGVDIVAGSMDPLRRLAIGHWLRRWWPASRQDGIAGLDRALLDVEIALLTVGAQGFFTDDTLDSDAAELLAPHAAALFTHVRSDDPRIADLVRAGAGLAEEIGVDDDAWAELLAVLDDSASEPAMPSERRDDYALAAGAGAGPGARLKSPGASHPSTGPRCPPRSSMRAKTPSSGRSRRGSPPWCGRRLSDPTRPPVSRCGCSPEPSAGPGCWTAMATRPFPFSTPRRGR